MSVVLRLTRKGRSKRPFYRIVATEKAWRRDGKYLELVGTLSTLTSPPTVTLKEDLVRKWIENGAVPSSVIRNVIRRVMPNFIEDREKHALSKVQAARKARKARAQARQAGGKAAAAPKKAKAPKATKAKSA